MQLSHSVVFLQRSLSLNILFRRFPKRLLLMRSYIAKREQEGMAMMSLLSYTMLPPQRSILAIGNLRMAT
jgi:hypothetical protein